MMVTVVNVKLPIGVRLNNPMNVKRTFPPTPWDGKTETPMHEVFESFISPHYGIRAGARILVNYLLIHKLDTIEEIIIRWAPPDDDNNTGSYIDFVAEKMGVTPETHLSLGDPEVLGALVVAMMAMEIGPEHASKFELSTIRAAVAAAYVGGKPGMQIVQPAPDASPLPPQPTPAVPTSTNKPPLVDQPTTKPTNKVIAASIGAAVGSAPLAFFATVLWNKYGTGEPMPEGVALAVDAAITGGAAFVFGYFARNRATPGAQG